MYEYFWLRDGIKVPATLAKETFDDHVIVRSPDPFDRGEIEYSLPRNLLELANPTHTFLHGSMAGTYRTECTVLKQVGEQVVIAYHDTFMNGPTEMIIHESELRPLS